MLEESPLTRKVLISTIQLLIQNAQHFDGEIRSNLEIKFVRISIFSLAFLSLHETIATAFVSEGSVLF